MKIVHINAFDSGGGAAIACARHCEAMIQAGHEVTMLVIAKSSRLPFVKKVHQGIKKVLIDLWDIQAAKLQAKIDPIGTFSLMKHGFDFSKDRNVQDADVIFLHWVNGNALSLNGVEDLLKLGKPVFWYMHDMFPITGGCHHALGCEGFMSDCRDCPLIKNDVCKSISSSLLRKKIRRWNKYDNLSFIAPSNWLANCAKNSSLCKGHDVFVVPNVLNVSVFKLIGIDAKKLFGLDHSKKTVLFGAASMGSVYKGTRFAHDCLKMLDPQKYEGLIIGRAPSDFVKDLDLRIVETGYLNDNLSLTLAYNACDTFIIPSVAENYPNVVLESMACGKPCVGFNTGGIPDLIKNGKSGLLAKEKKAKYLLQCLEDLFSDDHKYSVYSMNARKQIVDNNSYDKIMQVHVELQNIKIKNHDRS